MAGVDEITDRESLEAWLNTRPQADSVTIAQRTGLRVLPLWGREMDQAWSRKADLTALPVLRSLFVSGVARKQPTPAVKVAARTAYAAHAHAHATADADAFAAYAYSAAGYAVVTADTGAAAYTAAVACYDAAAAAADAAVWEQIRNDAAAVEQDLDLLALPLWLEDPPDWFTTSDTKMRSIWATDPATHWAFWTRWWDGALAGNPLNWDLQHDIAVNIPNEVWKAGPGPVAEAIAGIEVGYAIARTPNAELLAINPQTGLARVDPVSQLSSKHLSDVLDTLRDATTIFDGQGGSNGPYGSLLDECRLLDDALERYSARPVMLLRICRRVIGRVMDKEASGDCPKKDHLVRDFMASVSGAAGDLMAFDQDVREAENARAASNAAPPSPEMARAVVAAADQATEISEGVLASELPVDARVAVSQVATPERDVAIYQTKSRLLRFIGLIKSNAQSGKKHLDEHAFLYGSLLTIILFLLG